MRTYSELVRSGGLSVDDARAVPDIGLLLSRIWDVGADVHRCPIPIAARSCIRLSSGRARIIERARGPAAESTSNVQASTGEVAIRY